MLMLSRDWSGPGHFAQGVLFLAATLASACGDGGTELSSPSGPARATTIAVTPATVELTALGATVQLAAQVRDQNGQAMAGAAVTWSSGSTAVAAVGATGLVTATGNGTATITATSGSASGTATMTVAQAASEVAVTPTADTLAIGDTLRIAAEAVDANGNVVAEAAFTWSTNDGSVATVDGSGLVRGLGEGIATITAASGGVEASAEIAVQQPPLTLEEAMALFLGLTIGVEDWDSTLIRSVEETATTETVVRDCPLGGELTTTQEVALLVSDDVIRASSDGAQHQAACGFEYEDIVFTVDGDLRIQLEMVLSGTDLSIRELSGSVGGELDWMIEDRSATCTIAFDLVLGENPADPADPPLFFAGSLCSHDVKFEDSAGLSGAAAASGSRLRHHLSAAGGERGAAQRFHYSNFKEKS